MSIRTATYGLILETTYKGVYKPLVRYIAVEDRRFNFKNMTHIYTSKLNMPMMTVKKAREIVKADRYIVIGTCVQDITHDPLTYENYAVCNVWLHDGSNYEETVAIIEV